MSALKKRKYKAERNQQKLIAMNDNEQIGHLYLDTSTAAMFT